MPKSITICPIGFVEEEILERIAECIERSCGVVCKVAPMMENPKYAYNEKRRQYNSKSILGRLLQYPHESVRFIAVTHVDLYVPILKYVYGLAQIEGQCAVISLHRLHPQFYDEPPNPDLLISRAEKTALHELGHSLGLTHCRNWRCVMYSSAGIADTDKKQSRFCPTCFELLKWYLREYLR